MQHDKSNPAGEQLSALLDDELSAQELASLMRQTCDSLAEAATLQRYQLIGNTLRGELDAAAFMDVSAAVRRAIDLETPDANIVPLRPVAKFWQQRPWQQRLRPVAGLAIAASVAMVTVVSVRLLQQPNMTSPALVNISVVAPTVLPAAQLQLVADPGTPATGAADANRLNHYLLRHSGMAGQSSMQGLMPYARAVSFEGDTSR